MRRQTLIAIAAALILGLVAVYLANTLLNATQQRQEETELTRVAVAAVPMAYGTEITPDKIRFANYPKNSLPAGSFGNAAELFPKGERRIALMSIAPNEPILADKISGAGKNASIATLLPDGMRAASVRINDVSGVAGFVQPNDSVDVLITRDVPGGDHNTQMTDVLLQNVRVVAIDQQAKNADGSPKVAKTATLEVSPLDAQKLALAQEIGTLSLVLRKPGEQNNPVVETISLNDLRYNIYGGARYPAPAVVGGYGSGLGGAMAGAMNGAGNRIASATVSRPARKASSKPAAPATKSVQIYRGVEGNEVKVGGNGA